MKVHKNRQSRSDTHQSLKTFGFFGGVAMLLLLGSVQLKIAPPQSDGWVVTSFDEAVAEEFEDPKVNAAFDGQFGVGRGDARITGHLFYPYFIEVMKDGCQAAIAASELGAALSALMHHSKYSNITTFNLDALNKLVVRCIDKVERGESRAEVLNGGN
jgi:hypothetical protein